MRSMEQVSKIAKNAQGGVERTTQSVVQLTQLSQQLQQSMARFRGA